MTGAEVRRRAIKRNFFMVKILSCEPILSYTGQYEKYPFPVKRLKKLNYICYPVCMMTSPETCPHCEKPARLCACAALAPVDNRIFVLILRHPQEQDRELGTARIA